jgi:hypothetical protein
VTTQPAGEHHTGTLNLTGEGNAPEQVIYWCPTAREIETQPDGGFDRCCHAPELHEPVLAIVYAAIRQQVAEQIAAKLDERHRGNLALSGGDRDIIPRDGRVGLATGYQRAAAIAREIGGGA